MRAMGPADVVSPDRRPTGHVVAGGIVDTRSFFHFILLGEGDITCGSILVYPLLYLYVGISGIMGLIIATVFRIDDDLHHIHLFWTVGSVV